MLEQNKARNRYKIITNNLHKMNFIKKYYNNKTTLINSELTNKFHISKIRNLQLTMLKKIASHFCKDLILVSCLLLKPNYTIYILQYTNLEVEYDKQT